MLIVMLRFKSMSKLNSKWMSGLMSKLNLELKLNIHVFVQVGGVVEVDVEADVEVGVEVGVEVACASTLPLSIILCYTWVNLLTPLDFRLTSPDIKTAVVYRGKRRPCDALKMTGLPETTLTPREGYHTYY